MKKFLFTASAILVSAIFLGIFSGLQARSNGSIFGNKVSSISIIGLELACTNCHGGAANSYRCVLQVGPCSDTTNAVSLNIISRVSPNVGLYLLSVYPNPTRDMMYFYGAENSVEYSVIGIAWNVLRKGSVSPSQGVSLKSLPSECYFWKANSNGKSGAGRIIVQ